MDIGRPQKYRTIREILTKKCEQQVSIAAGGRWSWQHKTELDGDKWSGSMFHWERQNRTQVNIKRAQKATDIINLSL